MDRQTRIFPSTREAVGEASAFVLDALDRYGIGEDIQDAMLLAIGEAVANAAGHGNGLEAEKSITVSYWLNKDQVGLSVEDEGEGIEEHRLANAALPEDPMDTNGRGLFIMKSLADEVWLEEGGRRICLTWKTDDR